ncbi:MAG: hypothetical protein Q9227_007870 [Pyrenula ochraceoflavens]
MAAVTASNTTVTPDILVRQPSNTRRRTRAPSSPLYLKLADAATTAGFQRLRGGTPTSATQMLSAGVTPTSAPHYNTPTSGKNPFNTPTTGTLTGKSEAFLASIMEYYTMSPESIAASDAGSPMLDMMRQDEMEHDSYTRSTTAEGANESSTASSSPGVSMSTSAASPTSSMSSMSAEFEPLIAKGDLGDMSHQVALKALDVLCKYEESMSEESNDEVVELLREYEWFIKRRLHS